MLSKRKLCAHVASCQLSGQRGGGGESCGTLTACMLLQLGVAFSIGQVRVKATQKKEERKWKKIEMKSVS